MKSIVSVGQISIYRAVRTWYVEHGMEVQFDSGSGDGPKSWVVISRGLDRYVSEISAGCKQFVYSETRRAVGCGFDVCNRIKSGIAACGEFGTKQSPSENTSDTSLTGKITSSVRDQGSQYLPPNRAGRDSSLDPTLFSKPKAVPMRIPVKSMS